MAINVRFQNLAQANIEILKAFNSSNSAKALEAYQPLSVKERKLQKLRALQILKQSSESESLGDIALNTDSLALALTKAEGATLQAMLNLLSAKMIEQNKYSFITSEEESADIKKKVQEKLEEQKQEKQDQEEKQKQENSRKEEDKDNPLSELIELAINNLQTFQSEIQKNYSKFLDNFSKDNLKKVFDDGARLIVRYAYEVPIESFKEFILDPIKEFRVTLRKQLDSIAKGDFGNKQVKVFSHKEIRHMLRRSLERNREDKLQKSINDLNKAMMLKKKIKAQAKTETVRTAISTPKDSAKENNFKRFSSEDLRLALHK